MEQSTIQLQDIISVLHKNLKTSILLFVIPILLAVSYLHIATYKYTAELKIISTEGDGISLGSELGGLASLAGINIQKTETISNFRLYLGTLQSRQIAGELAKDPDVMKAVFSKQWNKQAQTWQDPRNNFLYSALTFLKKALGGYNEEWEAPAAPQLEEFLLDNLEISEDSKEAIVVMRYQHKDPEFAKTLLIKIHTLSDKLIRERTLERSKKHVEYIRRKLQSVSVAEYREALILSLAEQERFIMMASSNKAFAAEALWGVKSSPYPTSPKLAVVLLFAIMLGAISISGFGFFLALKKQEDKV